VDSAVAALPERQPIVIEDGADSSDSQVPYGRALV
jgi:hypothetical protein